MNKKIYAFQLTILSLVATAYPFIYIAERQYRARTYDGRFSLIPVVLFPLAFGICLSFINRNCEHQLLNIAFFILNFIIAAVIWGKLYYITTYNLMILGLLLFKCFDKPKKEKGNKDVERQFL